MSDYNLYKRSLNLLNGDIVNALRERYPNFRKGQCSMICRPEQYGMTLLPEAELLLMEKLGKGRGLAVKAKRNRKVKPLKSRRLAVSIDEQHYDRVKIKMQQMGCTSVQSFLEKLLDEAMKDESGNEN